MVRNGGAAMSKDKHPTTARNAYDSPVPDHAQWASIADAKALRDSMAELAHLIGEVKTAPGQTGPSLSWRSKMKELRDKIAKLPIGEIRDSPDS